MAAVRVPSAFAVAAGAWRRAGLALAWLAGVALQLAQPALWSGEAYPLLLAAGLALALVAGRCRGVGRRWAWRLLALAVLGFGFAGWRAELRLADALAPEWEDCDLALVGVVDGMPEVAADGTRFAFDVESARVLPMGGRDLRRLAALDAAAGVPVPSAAIGAAAPPEPGEEDPDAEAARPPPSASTAPRVPSRVWLSWNADPRDDRAVAAPPAPLRAGQRWRLPVRLRRPHGALNPDGFDAELWLFDQGLRAVGRVRGRGELQAEGGAPIERLRQWVRDRLLLDEAVPAAAAGTLAALAVGDQAAIAGADWEVFRDTGVAHLMSISGLHITMLGWLGGRLAGAAWRRLEQAPLRLPAPVVARWGGVGIAGLYALVAGWGVPAQRTVAMLAATALLRSAGLDWPPTLVALVAAVPVTVLDPWALLQPGFWLSFAAVLLLMIAEPAGSRRDEPPARADEAAGAGVGAFVRRGAASLADGSRGALRTQLVACIGLAPLALVAFRQVSPAGLLANLVAEPWITLLVTPLALAGALLPGLWTLAALALRPLLAGLAWLARWPWASVHVAAAPGWALAAGLAGGALLMLPLPWRVRLLGLAMLPPLAAPFVPRPPPGRFELVAADVGQGSAVLVRTRTHLLLFDTGPRFGEDSDAGRRMLLPLLQARGESRIDLLVLSHADADHVGGAQALIDRFPVSAMRSSLEAGHPLRANPIPHAPCLAGRAWDWDGVHFRFLHPPPADLRPGAKTNAVSCVLRIADPLGRSALLTGDIEAPQEAALVARAGAGGLRSDILVVPHHGSRTSSTEAFLDAVRPAVAVIQVGYRSRYGHPAPAVLARYGAHGIAVVRTDHCGAWSWRDGEGICARTMRRRYWGWPGPLELAPDLGEAARRGPVLAGETGKGPDPP
jgi:competence protein ComEC